MLRNYFVTAWRNLWKNRVYAAINIAGLAIGMAACIIILLFVFYEKSFDSMHKRNLYRLNEVQKFPGMVASQKVALSMFPMGPTMKAKFPQILQYTRVNWHDKFQVTYKDKRLFLPTAYMVDSTFLNMFDFPLLRSEGSAGHPGSNGIIRTTSAPGTPGRADRLAVLENPNSIVLTESAARKIFGDEDPIGKTIMHYDEDTLLFKVTGIVADVPQNSQMQFDALMSFNTVAANSCVDTRLGANETHRLSGADIRFVASNSSSFEWLTYQDGRLLSSDRPHYLCRRAGCVPQAGATPPDSLPAWFSL